MKARLDRLRLGLVGASRSLGAGVHELKVDVGPGCRVYFGNQGDSLVILLVGGNKRTQERDIAKAKAYWQEFKVG